MKLSNLSRAMMGGSCVRNGWIYIWQCEMLRDYYTGHQDIISYHFDIFQILHVPHLTLDQLKDDPESMINCQYFSLIGRLLTPGVSPRTCLNLLSAHWEPGRAIPTSR